MPILLSQAQSKVQTMPKEEQKRRLVAPKYRIVRGHDLRQERGFAPPQWRVAEKVRLTKSIDCRVFLHLCNLFGIKFNVIANIFFTNSPHDRKKSILAKVVFDAKRG